MFSLTKNDAYIPQYTRLRIFYDSRENVNGLSKTVRKITTWGYNMLEDHSNMNPNSLTIAGPTLLPDGHIEEQTIFCAGAQIERVAPGIDPGADLIVNGTIVPGLIDLQVNGAFGEDFTNDASTIAQVAARLPETGVTAYVPTIITSEFATYPQRLRDAAEAMEECEPPAARALGIHLEGPYLNPIRKGAHPATQIRPIDVEEIRRWAGHPAVRTVTLAPERENGLEAIRALAEMGLLVSVGHSNATYEQAVAAFEAGARWATHLYNAQSPLQHREPGVMGAILTSAVPCGIIADGIHSHPAMVKLAWLCKGKQGITLVTDCMAAMGMPAGRYELGEFPVVVTAQDARLDDGTLAGSILRMDDAVRNMMAYSGCTLAEAVYMASTGPARLLGLTDRGLLQAGLRADITVLSAEGRASLTLVGGMLAYSAQ